MNEKQPLLTIVIPVHNRERLVGRTLQSVAAQTIRPLAVVLVDNASTDGTLSVLKQWAEGVQASDFSVSVLSEPKPGASCARNRGLEAVRTEWTMFFDSDDEMLPDHARRAVETVMKHPQADVIGWNLMLHRLNGSRKILPFEPENIIAHNILHGTMATLRYCARTELFKQAGGWSEDLGTWDDIELGQRLLLLKPNIIKVCGKPTALIYETADSISGTHDSQRVDSCLRALEKITQNKAPKALVGLKKAVLAGDCTAVGNPRGKELFKTVVENEPNMLNRLIFHCIYITKCRRLPGAGRLLYRLLQ